MRKPVGLKDGRAKMCTQGWGLEAEARALIAFAEAKTVEAVAQAMVTL